MPEDRPDPPHARRIRWPLEAPSAALPIDPDLTPADPAEPSVAHRPGHGASARLRSAILMAVFAGGFLGTMARYGAVIAWPTPPGRFPLTVFIINLTGGFLLGWILSFLLSQQAEIPHADLLRPFLGTGLLGGWTTYSSFAVGADVLAHSGAIAIAAVAIVGTIAGGLVTTASGLLLGRAMFRRRGPLGSGAVQ